MASVALGPIHLREGNPIPLNWTLGGPLDTEWTGLETRKSPLAGIPPTPVRPARTLVTMPTMAPWPPFSYGH